MYSRIDNFKIICQGFILLFLVSCTSNEPGLVVTITNTSNLPRESEPVEVWADQLPSLSEEEKNKLVVYDEMGNSIKSQWIDENSDAVKDYLLFQTTLNGQEKQNYKISIQADTTSSVEDDIKTTYARFVPERMDDFAWENDQVAFRTYGPKCQQLFEEGNPGGLISSGIDCWLKRVDYPIIDQWYSNNEKGISYHVDHGEGLDNYHVGTTRGCGGTALICGDDYIKSENFTSWNIIANGPIRTIFELNYDAIDVCENEVIEKKKISIDLGSNFFHCEVFYTGNNAVDVAQVGITTHGGAGEIRASQEKGWVAYWEPIDDSALGTAILVDPTITQTYLLDATIHEDESLNNVGINIKVRENTFSYKAGFGWKKRGRYQNLNDWEASLNQEAIKIKHPLKIEITKN